LLTNCKAVTVKSFWCGLISRKNDGLINESYCGAVVVAHEL